MSAVTSKESAIPTKLREASRLIKDTVFDFIDGDASMLGGALSFYMMLALSPLLIVILAFASPIYDQSHLRGEIVARVHARVGAEAAQLVNGLFDHMQGGDSFWATVVGIALTLYATTRLFLHLQLSLNYLWGVPKPEPMPLSASIRVFLKQRALSIGMLFVVGTLIVLVLVLPAVLAGLRGWFGFELPGGDTVFRIGRGLVTLGLLTLFIASLYKALPDVKIAWKDVWIGAAGTAVLFVAAQALIGLYFTTGSPGSPYGAAGSLSVILLWVYYQSQVFFLGALFTHRYAMRTA